MLLGGSPKRKAAGSNPVRGAKNPPEPIGSGGFCLRKVRSKERWSAFLPAEKGKKFCAEFNIGKNQIYAGQISISRTS